MLPPFHRGHHSRFLWKSVYSHKPSSPLPFFFFFFYDCESYVNGVWCNIPTHTHVNFSTHTWPSTLYICWLAHRTVLYTSYRTKWLSTLLILAASTIIYSIHIYLHYILFFLYILTVYILIFCGCNEMNVLEFIIANHCFCIYWHFIIQSTREHADYTLHSTHGVLLARLGFALATGSCRPAGLYWQWLLKQWCLIWTSLQFKKIKQTNKEKNMLKYSL